MTSGPSRDLAAVLADVAGAPVVQARRIGGGDINDAWRVRLGDDRELFVKTRPDAPAGEFATEAAALAWLAQPGTLAVPAVAGLHDPLDEHEPRVSGPRLLALQWISPGRLDAAGEEQLGRGLAGVHRAGAAVFGVPPPTAPARPGGGVRELRLGSVSLPNEPLDDWPSFYRERRLAPLIAMALDAGSLSAEQARPIELVCERLEQLAGPPEPPARLHGDLWSGNVLAGSDGRARLIDPAAHGGHREVDLAMLELFGSPPRRVLDAYAEAFPLADGHEQRVGLWQLLPLLVHAVLFGASYGAAAAAAALRYVGANRR